MPLDQLTLRLPKQAQSRNKGNGTCKEVLEAEPIEAYLGLKVPGITPIEKNDNKEPEAGVIALGSSISIHQ